MSEYMTTAIQVAKKSDNALRVKAEEFGIQRAVYFNVVSNYQKAALVNPWDIRSVSSDFADNAELRKELISYLNSEIGPIASRIRDQGIIFRSATVFNNYKIAIYGKMIGPDVFISGISAESQYDGDQVNKLLISDDYDATADFFAIMSSEPN
jgi:hypothetical protein